MTKAKGKNDKKKSGGAVSKLGKKKLKGLFGGTLTGSSQGAIEIGAK